MSFTAAAYSASAAETIGGSIAEMQCQSVVTKSGTVFNIMDLENTKFYKAKITNSTDKLWFNYCTFGVIPEDAYGVVVDTDAITTVVASKRLSSAINIRDENERIVGI